VIMHVPRLLLGAHAAGARQDEAGQPEISQLRAAPRELDGRARALRLSAEHSVWSEVGGVWHPVKTVCLFFAMGPAESLGADGKKEPDGSCRWGGK
jgi:hypothetical protein